MNLLFQIKKYSRIAHEGFVVRHSYFFAVSGNQTNPKLRMYLKTIAIFKRRKSKRKIYFSDYPRPCMERPSHVQRGAVFIVPRLYRPWWHMSSMARYPVQVSRT